MATSGFEIPAAVSPQPGVKKGFAEKNEGGTVWCMFYKKALSLNRDETEGGVERRGNRQSRVATLGKCLRSADFKLTAEVHKKVNETNGNTRFPPLKSVTAPGLSAKLIRAKICHRSCKHGYTAGVSNWWPTGQRCHAQAMSTQAPQGQKHHDTSRDINMMRQV
ncbi:hypothetical protein L345_09347 [Ophiophagus hannah]|uniref:Uncharacterized protein n=1 Tax=Ophiophagus hannah TaxID=8665 RepID=V8NT72_OPHHA|nr:hypothetical protein L345_09347 [Ophiophagus hannah]